MIIRPATDADVAAITRIHNALIETTTYEYRDARYEEDERRDWLRAKQRADLPVLVADVDGEVCGFAAYGPFRDNEKWPGYATTVEHSVHVDAAAQGRDVGRRLMDALLDAAVARGIHAVIGAIDSSNDGSIRFHERLGFVEEGRLREVGRKHGQRLDLVLMSWRDDGTRARQ